MIETGIGYLQFIQTKQTFKFVVMSICCDFSVENLSKTEVVEYFTAIKIESCIWIFLMKNYKIGIL